jgi:hypothetical protein
MRHQIDLQILGETNWPVELVNAMAVIETEVEEGRSIPAVRARRLLIDHIGPLVPSLDLEVIIPSKNPTWEELVEAGKRIDGEASNHLEQCVGSLLIYLDSHFSWGLRRKETTSFCRLCWRHTIDNKKFCVDHDPRKHHSEYRRHHRLLPVFQDMYRNLHVLDQINGCKSKWGGVLQDESLLYKWMRRYRPASYDAIPDLFPTFPDLLERLDIPKKEEESDLKRERAELHKELLKNPDDLSGLLRRSEAWLRVLSLVKHGGARKNAGRKPKQC